MLRRCLFFFAPLVLALAFLAPAAHAQTPASDAEKSDRSTSALPYAVAILYTMLVMSIVCIPTRKA